VAKWRLTLATLAAIMALAPAHSRAQPFDDAQGKPSLDEVLQRTARYVEAFRTQLSGIVTEEVYQQEILNTSRFVNSLLVNAKRRLKSELLLVKPADSDRYVELRDVLEVDGARLENHQGRLEKLLNEPASGSRIAAIIQESARYNIGSVRRNINTPLMALQFLDAARRPRIEFKHVGKAAPVFKEKQDQALNESTVFRVSTEMWNVEFKERGRGTMIQTPNGDDLPAKGRFWIDPSNGSVLISELNVDGGGVNATVTVSYQSEPLMGFLVPVEMREVYDRNGERITGHAEYGKFRQISK
jgi:hypothetical protein